VKGWVARVFGRRGSERISSAPTAAAGEEADASSAAFNLLFDQAEQHLNSGRNAQAQGILTDALMLKHDSASAHYKLGLALLRQEQIEAAADSFVMALCFAPQMSQAHFALALAERKQGKSAEALTSVERAIGCGQAMPEMHNLRGALLLDMGDVAAAVASFENALATDRNHAVAHSNLGYVLFRDCGDYERGARHMERALELDPENLDFQCNHTMILAHRGEHERAIAACDRLLSAQPEMNEARLNRALVLLALGEYRQGWDDYEARKSVRCNFVARDFPCAEWHGEDLGEKSILVHGEQGFGDEIMFASCFSELIARAGRCVVECAPALEGLFRRSFPKATVFGGKQTAATPSWWATAPAIDVHVSAGSLPQYFRRSRAEFPMHHGYLVPDPERVACWRDRLATPGRGLKVGISWRGGMPSTRRNLRSIDLSTWTPLLQVQGTRFVSLQYGDTTEERARLAGELGWELDCWQEAIDDMDETAALVAALDVVISVCTAVVHLTGAIGRPVWILVPTAPEWRYQLFGDAMPWYPSAALIRQKTANEWRPAIAEATRRLREMVLDREHAG
jgi:tetratricopeptide (TPR) repeat protein